MWDYIQNLVLLHTGIHSKGVIQDKIKAICTKAFMATLFTTVKIGYT